METSPTAEQDRDQRMAELADTAPALNIEMTDRTVVIHHCNLASCRINYYPMEIELLFSRNPFLQNDSGKFAFIRPARTDRIALPADGSPKRVELPAAYRNRNVMVEVLAEGIRVTRSCYAHSIVVHFSESYGQVRVTANQEAGGDPLPQTYVKVYARLRNGEIRFYKDGYTDFRGWFDYASLSTDLLGQVERFAVLILNPRHGAVVHEVAPPRS
jgi:hypothetical protein